MAERVFLGWHEPALSQAARWLVDRFDRDFSDVLVALPGRRAGRRLEEHLAEVAPDAAFIPPEITTAGRLTDVLLRSGAALAGRLARTLVWARVLETQGLSGLVTRAPVRTGAAGWWALAEELRGLHGELRAEGLDFDDMQRELGASGPRGEALRWRVLARLQAAYRSSLAALDLLDPHDARWQALDAGRLEDGRQVVLVGVVEVNGLLRRLLEQLGDLTCLVAAPSSAAARFDGLGCVVPGAWSDLDLDLPRWTTVNDPADQATRAMEGVVRAGRRRVTIGVPDAEVVAPLRSRLGAAARPAAGRPLAATRPARLLAALAGWLESGSFDEASALVRHPDLERRLRRDPGDDVVRRLDEHAAVHVPLHLGATGLEDLVRRLKGLLGDLADSQRRRPLPEWASAISAALVAVYGEQELRRDGTDRELVQALEEIGAVLAEWAELPAGLAGAQALRPAEALHLTLRALADRQVPPPPGPGGVDLLGWLELPLDDAPVLVVTGFNEGRVPAGLTSHAFLPDALRTRLGLPDDIHRLTRDTCALATILQPWRAVELVSGRRSALGDPLRPSRLAFRCADDEIPRRVRTFLPEPGETQPAVVFSRTPRALPMGAARPAPERLSVGALGDYLQSPYRFYLKHVLELREVGPDPRELSPWVFGSLAHDVLEAFGSGPEADSGNEQAVADDLQERLGALAAERFGRTPRPAVALQLERLAYRLRLLASWQADRVRAGWRIRHVEWSPPGGGAVPFDVDGELLQLSGRIDRIDEHEGTGQWAILDYKTGEAGADPHKVHGPDDEGRWRNLQLPLYRELVAPLELEGSIALGYVALPKDVRKLGLQPASWTDEQLGQAVAVARDVVRAIRRGEFQSLGQHPDPRYEPVFAALAGVGLAEAGDDEEGAGDD